MERKRGREGKIKERGGERGRSNPRAKILITALVVVVVVVIVVVVVHVGLIVAAATAVQQHSPGANRDLYYIYISHRKSLGAGIITWWVEDHQMASLKFCNWCIK